MLAILKAFAWMRWRVLVNSFDRTGARDVVERFSVAMDQITPIVALLLLVPSALMLAGFGGFTGYALRGGGAPLSFEIARYMLLGGLVAAIVGPLMLPAAGRPNIVRLLLLPIPRGTLYVGQAAASVADPWVLLAIPLLLGIPAGLLLGGRPAAGFIALLGGLLLFLVLVGASTATSMLLQLLFRDRRRGEMAALLFIVIFPMLAVLPELLEGSGGSSRRGRGDGPRPPVEEQAPSWARRAFGLTPYVPPMLYASAARAAADGDPADGLARLVPLAGFVILSHGIAFVVFLRLLESPATTGGRRQSGRRAQPWRTIPGVSAAVSAVATAQIRLALRTPRGRSILLSPILVFVVFGLLMRRNAGEMDLGFLSLSSGPALATFGACVCLLGILPFAMNQFAIDGAGLTLALLAPMDDGEYLMGKAIGNAAIAGGPAIACILAAFVLFPSGAAALWLSIPLGVLSAYVLVAPAAAALSTLFPRPVDLNSIGRGSNAQGLAGFVGLIATAAACVPPAVLTGVVIGIMGRPAVLPLVLAVWCAFAFGISAVLFRPVRALFRTRRENLALVVS
jgi:hypothetical protein